MNNIQKMHVYVTYDPLYEKVICVHSKPNKVCESCKEIKRVRQLESNTYLIEEEKFLVKTTKTERFK